MMATGDGVVSKLDVARNKGQHLEVEHASGFSTSYARVSSFSVRSGYLLLSDANGNEE